MSEIVRNEELSGASVNVSKWAIIYNELLAAVMITGYFGDLFLCNYFHIRFESMFT